MSDKRPGGRRPPPGRGRKPGRGGMGDDDGRYYGWRDPGQGDPRTQDVVFDPTLDPNNATPEERAQLDGFFSRFKAELKRPLVFFVKRPAFLEPPFFSKPLTKVKNGLQVAGGSTALIFDREIEARQRVIVVNFGIDLAPILPLYNGQLEFWFQLGKRGVAEPSDRIIPIFDDQTPTGYGGSTPVQGGRTTVLPGSVEIPYSFMQHGLTFGVHGPANLQVLVQNKGGVTVTMRGILGFYQYWAAGPGGQTEFAEGDFQV